MIKAKHIYLFSIILIFLFSGCVSRVLDFTIVSSKNVDMRIKDTAKGSRVTGRDHAWWILFFPTGRPNLKEAVDRAIESAGPGYDALIDGVIYSEFSYFLLASKSGFKVVGTPVKTKEIVAELKQKDEDADKFFESALYHSSLGIDNTKTIERIGVIRVK